VGHAQGMTDARQFGAFVREYQDMVFATAVRLLGRQADAEDVSQTVFLKAFERFDDIGPSPTAAGWLKTVTTNLCLNHLTRDRARWQSLDEITPAAAGALATAARTDATPASALEHADRQARIERAVRGLPDHQRVPLVLFHFEEMSYQDIATTLGVSLGKVKTDIHRGRDALKKELLDVDGSR
jgi:RNA polymerase sigma-70 factor, ECF subfamily